MASKDIKLNPDETLGYVSKIAATMAEVSVPGPVPPPSAPTSPIDVALNSVAAAAAEKAAASAEALAARGTEHNARITNCTAISTAAVRATQFIARRAYGPHTTTVAVGMVSRCAHW